MCGDKELGLDCLGLFDCLCDDQDGCVCADAGGGGGGEERAKRRARGEGEGVCVRAGGGEGGVREKVKVGCPFSSHLTKGRAECEQA